MLIVSIAMLFVLIAILTPRILRRGLSGVSKSW